MEQLLGGVAVGSSIVGSPVGAGIVGGGVLVAIGSAGAGMAAYQSCMSSARQTYEMCMDICEMRGHVTGSGWPGGGSGPLV